MTYCESDVECTAAPAAANSAERFDLGVALYHGEFAAVSALMEHHGVPIDMEIFPQLADNETWRAVRDDMVPAIDAQVWRLCPQRRRRLVFQHGAASTPTSTREGICLAAA